MANKLKIRDEDYNVLLERAREVKRNDPYIIARMERDTDWTSKRMRWTLFHHMGIRIGDGVGMSGDLNLYAYMNDDHIDSALKQVCRDIGEYYAAG